MKRLIIVLAVCAFAAACSSGGSSYTITQSSNMAQTSEYAVGDDTPAQKKTAASSLNIDNLPSRIEAGRVYEFTVASAAPSVVVARVGSFENARGRPTSRLDLPPGTHVLRYVLPRGSVDDEITVTENGDGQSTIRRFTVSSTR